MANKIKRLPQWATPLSWEFQEEAGYDCMYSGYVIKDKRGHELFTLDCRDFDQDACTYKPVPEAEAVAQWIVDKANRERRR